MLVAPSICCPLPVQCRFTAESEPARQACMSSCLLGRGQTSQLSMSACRWAGPLLAGAGAQEGRRPVVHSEPDGGVPVQPGSPAPAGPRLNDLALAPPSGECHLVFAAASLTIAACYQLIIVQKPQRRSVHRQSLPSTRAGRPGPHTAGSPDATAIGEPMLGRLSHLNFCGVAKPPRPSLHRLGVFFSRNRGEQNGM